MKMRVHTGFRDVSARCEDCGKEWFTRNAQGVAAQHTDRTGHQTSVEIQQHVSYFIQGKRKK